MPFAVLLVGAILVVVAFNNTAGTLATQLEGDIPGYFKWAAAIAAILGLGYIPGLRTPSRYLLGLVLFVVLLVNYTNIINGFKTFLTTTPTTGGGGNPNPTTPYATNPTSNAAPSASAIAGTGGGSTATPNILGGSVMGGLLSGGINLGSKLFGSGGAANPSTGANLGLGN
jgi:hypothetical protein